MMTQFAQQYPYGLIRYTQSTFLELVTDTEVHRIDFRGKLSWRLRRGTRGPVSFHHEHPLLVGVNGQAVTLLARATPYALLHTSALLQAIRQELRTLAGPWYDFERHSWAMWWQRLMSHNIDAKLTRTGGIILSGVPASVAEAVANICTRYSVQTYYQPPVEYWYPSEKAANALLLIGNDYIIARKFCVSTLCGNSIRQR